MLSSVPLFFVAQADHTLASRAETEHTIGRGTSLSLAISGSGLVRLPLELPLRSGEAAMVRRKFAGQPQLLKLRRQLLERLHSLATVHPDLVGRAGEGGWVQPPGLQPRR